MKNFFFLHQTCTNGRRIFLTLCKLSATLASNQACFWIQSSVPVSNQSFHDCINIYKHSILMAAGVMYQLWPGASKLCISNKYTVVNHRLKTIAELMGWLFECMPEISNEDNTVLGDCESPYLWFEIIWCICFDERNDSLQKELPSFCNDGYLSMILITVSMHALLTPWPSATLSSACLRQMGKC